MYTYAVMLLSHRGGGGAKFGPVRCCQGGQVGGIREAKFSLAYFIVVSSSFFAH